MCVYKCSTEKETNKEWGMRHSYACVRPDAQQKSECVVCVTIQAGKMIESVLVVNACICKGKHLFVYRKGERESGGGNIR